MEKHIDREPTQQELLNLWSECRDFIKELKISDVEDIYQRDAVIESAYEFIEGVTDIVGYVEFNEDDWK